MFRPISTDDSSLLVAWWCKQMTSLDADLTIVVATYNLGRRLEPCLESLEDALLTERVRVVFVDDASTDGTFERLKSFADGHEGVHVDRLAVNSGSPSAPRNRGLELVETPYLFILDGDDSIICDNVLAGVDAAQDHDWEIVRGYLISNVPETARFPVDRLHGDVPSTKRDLVECFVRNTTVGSMAVISSELVHRLGARFDESVHMGEDLRFMADLIVGAESVGYIDRPLFTYNKVAPGERSATTTMGDAELIEFAASWRYVEFAYRKMGISFLSLHGAGTINYGLTQMIWYSGPISRDAFEVFSEFVAEMWETLSVLNFRSRVQEILDAASEGDLDAFNSALRPRMLIAGHDLKFIKGAEPALERYFSVDYDEWESERQQDANRSLELLRWADFVWVEWMTRASVWYSRNVSPSQPLLIRCHFYELTRDDGFEIDQGRVSAFITIAVHTYEDLIDRFNLPRSKVRLIPNFYNTSGYAKAAVSDDRRFRLALVGSVPRRKGYARALQLLERLRRVDGRYTLTVMGKQHTDFDWVANDPTERAYYGACDRYIEEHDLGAAVSFEGWVDTRAELSSFGFVLSMSDFEGSHVAPGEAFCAGSFGLFLPWLGCEYVYPKESIFRSVDDMAEFVLRSDPSSDKARPLLEGAKEFLAANQDIDIFVDEVRQLVVEFGGK